jgi:hypothetical protein
MMIKTIISGTATKRQFALYFFTLLTIFLSLLLLAQSFFPGGFSIYEEYISAQGDPVDNPQGCWFFIFGAGFTGIFLIPFYLYLYRRLSPTTLLISKAFRLLGIIGSIGLSIVGFFPRGGAVDLIHDIGADLAFNGSGLAAFCSLIILFRKLMLKEKWPKIWQFLLLYGTIFGIGLLIPFQNNSELTQWTGFFILLFWMIGLFLVIPDLPPHSEK